MRKVLLTLTFWHKIKERKKRNRIRGRAGIYPPGKYYTSKISPLSPICMPEIPPKKAGPSIQS